MRFESPLFSLLASPSKRKHPGFACIVSKKVSARAVDRNRAKRILRAGYSNIVLTTPNRWDVVVIAKRALLDADGTLAGEQMADLLRQLEKRIPSGTSAI